MNIVNERFKDFDKSHCWQYEMRIRNLEDDMLAAGLCEYSAAQLRTNDFDFEYVPKEDKQRCQEIKQFISELEFSPQYSLI